MILKKYYIYTILKNLIHLSQKKYYIWYYLLTNKYLLTNIHNIKLIYLQNIHNNSYSLSNTLKLLNITDIKFNFHKNFLYYFSIIHLQEYFSSIFNYSFCFRATNLIILVKNYYNIIKSYFFNIKLLPKLEFIYPCDIFSLFFCSLMIKDIFFLQIWIKKQFERKSIKLFKPLIYTVWLLFKTFGWKLRKFTKLTGIFLTFKGKIIKGGSRKQLMDFKIGELRSSSKTNKFLSTSFVLRTMSGSISCRLYLTY